ncbi:murein biosynthesis integral membrane protein MurJ [Candidatus Dependentiae bacterium]|nr:murein biosynthesis integral membrane protein MurJ [Candidatus Dependentiae bacterium]
MNRQAIRQKTVQVASSTMISRLLGMVREVLMANLLGVGVIADAFITAFKIPNSMRKVFAEGALSAALVPTFVSLGKKDDKQAVSSLMTLSLLIFEGILLVLCVLIFWKAEAVIRFIAPGWYCIPQQREFVVFGIPVLDKTIGACVAFLAQGQAGAQVAYAVSFLRLLIGFILFLSTSALLASALQSVNDFFVPAFAQVLINVIFIGGILLCMIFNWPIKVLCGFILFSGLAHMLWHLIAYFRVGFSFAPITEKTWVSIRQVLRKFLPCLLSMSVMELLLVVSTSIASFLPAGSISLVYYANRFMGIPLGVFSRAFSTVLFPYFARVGTYARSRLSFFLFEAAKLIFWVMVPVSLIFAFISEKLFLTLFLSKKFTMVHVQEASTILIIFVTGLFFFSLNHILLNLYYALHETRIPLYISVAVLLIDVVLSYYILMPLFGAAGIALTTVIVSALQTVLFTLGLQYFFGIVLYTKRFASFALKSVTQCTLLGAAFAVIYYAAVSLINSLGSWAPTLLTTLMFWAWFCPLAVAFFLALFRTRRYFGISLYFLE